MQFWYPNFDARAVLVPKFWTKTNLVPKFLNFEHIKYPERFFPKLLPEKATCPATIV